MEREMSDVMGLLSCVQLLVKDSKGGASAVEGKQPSFGSDVHHLGRCKPCAFFHTKGCSSGEECRFCHLCPPNEKHRRKLLARFQTGKTASAQAATWNKSLGHIRQNSEASISTSSTSTGGSRSSQECWRTGSINQMPRLSQAVHAMHVPPPMASSQMYCRDSVPMLSCALEIDDMQMMWQQQQPLTPAPMPPQFDLYANCSSSGFQCCTDIATTPDYALNMWEAQCRPVLPAPQMVASCDGQQYMLVPVPVQGPGWYPETGC